MIIYYVTVFGMTLLFGATVVWGLWWSVRGGQFSNFNKGARSIFTDDEPEGVVTDLFPDVRQTLDKSADSTPPPISKDSV